MKRVFKPFEEGSSDVILILGNQNMTTGGSRRERKRKRKNQEESETLINIDDTSTASTSNTPCPAEPETITDFNEILSSEFEDENVPASTENENFQDTHDAEETRIKKTSSKGNNNSGGNKSGNRCGSNNVGSGSRCGGSSNSGGCDNGSGFHTGECQPRNARGRRLRRNSSREDGKPVHKRQKQAILAFCEETYYFDDRRPKEVRKKKRHTKTIRCIPSPPPKKAKRRSRKKKKARSSSNPASPSNTSPLPAASPGIMVLPPDSVTPPPHVQDSVAGGKPGRDVDAAITTGDPPSTGTTFAVKPITSSTDAQAGTEDCMEYVTGPTRAVACNVPTLWVVPASYYEPNVPMCYIDAFPDACQDGTDDYTTESAAAGPIISNSPISWVVPDLPICCTSSAIVYANAPCCATNANTPTCHANVAIPTCYVTAAGLVLTSPEPPDYFIAPFQALAAANNACWAMPLIDMPCHPDCNMSIMDDVELITTLSSDMW